jgi:hypothetical protein
VYSLETARSRSTQIAPTNERAYYQTHYGTLQWNNVLSRKTGFMLDAGASYTPESVQAGLGRHFDISGEARYRHREGTGGFPDIDGYQAGLFVSFFGPRGAGGPRFGR